MQILDAAQAWANNGCYMAQGGAWKDHDTAVELAVSSTICHHYRTAHTLELAQAGTGATHALTGWP